MTPKEGLELAAQHFIAGRYGSAELLYEQVIAVTEEPFAIAALGTLYLATQNPGRAIVLLKYAHEKLPNFEDAMINLAGAYRLLDNTEQSVHWNMKALAVNPDNPVTLSNLSGAHVNAASPQKAIMWADAALKRNPDMIEARRNRSIALLELGRFEEGWKEYDSRIGSSSCATRPYTCPQWNGERTSLLAISGEQGLGDEVMFLTLIEQVRPLVDGIVLEVAPRLVKLVSNSFPDLQVYGTCEELLEHETPTAWTHLGCLPQFVWPVHPNPYLRPKSVYPRREKKRIGFSWRGGTMHTHERLRNFPLDHWKKLILPEYDCISLQYGERAKDAEFLGIEHDPTSIADLDALAAMIATCDLVVSVTNTTVHMAGALGIPCISIVPSKPDWRCGLHGERMLWYDSVRMIRQKPGEDWAVTTDRVKAAIEGYFALKVAA